MLPKRHRLTEHRAFSRLARSARAGGPLMVVHAHPRGVDSARSMGAWRPNSTVPLATRVGFAVPRSVGNAVTRNRVKRRLRALMAVHLSELPGNLDLLVRVHPPAAMATYGRLEDEVVRLTEKVIARLTPPRSSGARDSR